MNMSWCASRPYHFTRGCLWIVCLSCVPEFLTECLSFCFFLCVLVCVSVCDWVSVCLWIVCLHCGTFLNDEISTFALNSFPRLFVIFDLLGHFNFLCQGQSRNHLEHNKSVRFFDILWISSANFEERFEFLSQWMNCARGRNWQFCWHTMQSFVGT